jgi:DNA helicase-2/ATP-dependent DNA helicase PcrA
MTTRYQSTTKWSKDLEGPALSIAGTTATPLRVTAGPGTGKTFALMRRVARLVEDGADPSRILVITFTRTAARDITREISRIEADGASEVISGTLHSYCFKMLAKASVFEFTNRVARTLIEFEKKVLYEDLKIHGIRSITDCKGMVKAFEADWARLQHEKPGWPTDPADQQFHQELMDWFRFHESMLLGELPTLALTFLRQNPATPERSAFDHVLVDEYQDLNRADQVLIDILAEHGTLTVIGDEDQSIYGRIRYAQPEGIRDFADYHPHTHSESMDICRRCPVQVIEMANQLISVNRDRETRSLVPIDATRSGFVRIVQWPTMEQEASGLAQFVRLYLDKNPEVQASDVLVLSPRRGHGRRLTNELKAQGISAISYFFDDAFQQPLAQERFTLLTLVVHPEDRVSLRCWMGIGHGSAAAIPYGHFRRHCDSVGISPIQAIEAIAAGPLRLRNDQHLKERWQLLQRERAAIENLVGQDLIDALFPATETSTEELRLIATMLQERIEDDITPPQLHEAILDRIINPEPPEADGHVRVMSAYKAKGLTVKLVVMAGAVETWYPTPDDNLTGDALLRHTEEQRRLFYVGITRPTDALVISSFASMPSGMVYGTLARARQHRRGRGYGLASQFIDEMGTTAPGTVIGDTLLAEMIEL